MIIRFLIGGLALLCLVSMSAQPNSFSEIDQLFSEWDDLSQPGCAVGIFKDGEILYQKGFGAANLEHRVPITPSTTFRIGSVTKQFTAACILLLVEDGKLSIDAQLSEFYPSFPAYTAKITLRHLLYHTSGIRDYDQLIQYCPSCDFDSFYKDDLLDMIQRQKALNMLPGEAFMYTNSGYWLLGDIVEKISGMSLAAFAQERLFGPLGMQQSLYLDDYTKVIPKRAYGYEEDEASPLGYWWYNTTNSLVGDDGMFTSILDFKRWDDAYYQQKTLSPSFWNLALRKGILNNGDTLNYAAGIEHLNHKGWPIHKHTGSSFGYCSIFIRVPALQLTVVVLSNRGEAFSIEEKSKAILDLLISQQHAPTNEHTDIPINLPKQSLDLSNFCGYYWSDESYLVRQIYQKGDTLFYGPDQNAGYPIWPHGFNRFKAENGLEIVFSKLEYSGFSMQTFREGRTLSAFRVFSPLLEEKLDLSVYTGTFYSDEILAEYSFIQHENKLIWQSEGELVSRLMPIMEDMFRSSGGTNFEFLRDKDGRISSFKMGNRRLRGVAFTRKDE